LFQELGREPSLEEVLESVLEELLWFLGLERRYPERFCHLFEHSFAESVVSDLAAFLELKPDERWLASVMENRPVKSAYRHDEKLNRYYVECVEERFLAYPSVLAKLLEFANKGN
jgi:hypothetical protein